MGLAKRKTKAVWLVVLGTLLVGFYAGFVEPNWIEVRHVVVDDSILATQWDGLKIMQLTDLHIVQPGYREKRILQAVVELHPDLIVLTGDLTQWGKSPVAAQEFIAKLQAPYGVYAVLGDADPQHSRQACAFCHKKGPDYSQRVSSPYVLQNESLTIDLAGGKHLRLVGISHEMSGVEYLRQLDVTDQAPRLVLAHKSVWWASPGLDAPQLWLSGDTHGGQIYLPNFIWERVRYKEDFVHMAGLFHGEKNRWLYVCRGLGTTHGFPFRFGVRPEITLITFQNT